MLNREMPCGDYAGQPVSEVMEKARKMHQITRSGMVYDWWLVSAAGAGFALFREPHHTEQEIHAAKTQLKSDRDVIGRIRIVDLREPKAQLDELVTRFGAKPEPFGVPDIPKAPMGVIYRGSCLVFDIFGSFDGYSLGDALPYGFVEVEEWASRPFRMAWKNDALRAIVTYCEHDVSVTVDESEEGYALRLQSAAAFYREY